MTRRRGRISLPEGAKRWAFLAASAGAAGLTANALRPPTRGRPAQFAFLPGFLVSELPLQQLALHAGATVAAAAAGTFAEAPPHAVAGLALTAASAAGLGYLALGAARSGKLLEAALDEGLGRDGSDRSAGSGGRRPRSWRDSRPLVFAVPRLPRSIERIRGIDYWGDGRKLHMLDIYRQRPVDGEPLRDGAPVLLYVHGGAWVMGDKREQGLSMMHHLAARGVVCVSTNYRLSPRATWPEHLVDCKRALAFVHEHIAEYGGDPSRIVVAGGSAGGHLASLLALTQGDPEHQPGFEEADTTVAGCVGLYGVYNFTLTDEGDMPQLRRLLEQDVLKRRIADDRRLFESASPISLVGPTAPPFLVVHGRNDTVVPVETARAFVAALSEASKSPVVYAELPLAQHAFDLLWSVRTAATARAIEDFLFTAVEGRP